jgi:hypothetical protein
LTIQTPTIATLIVSQLIPNRCAGQNSRARRSVVLLVVTADQERETGRRILTVDAGLPNITIMGPVSIMGPVLGLDCSQGTVLSTAIIPVSGQVLEKGNRHDRQTKPANNY